MPQEVEWQKISETNPCLSLVFYIWRTGAINKRVVILNWYFVILLDI